MHLSGSITALATPFTASGDLVGELDLQAWDRLLQSQIDAGTEGVVVAGSTGEANALGDDEYETLLRRAVALVAGRIPVLAGTGLPNTAKTIALTRRAAAWISSGSLIRPGPVSPPVRGPSAGPMTCTPLEMSVAMFATVAGCCHISVCIAGAISTGARVASRVVPSRSEASPAAIDAIVLAVAGATTTRSAR